MSKEQLMKLYMKSHDIHNVLLSIKNRLFKLSKILLLTLSKQKNK